MELDYASPPPAAPPARRQSADMLGSTSRSSQAVGSTSSIAKTGEPLTTVDTSNDAVAFKESNAACRILDELLGDMLSIVEEQDSSSDEDGDERNINSESESWSTSSSTSDAEDNSDTLKLPISKAGSPRADSEMEEGELESEHEVESKRIQVEAKLKEAEERKGRREEKKKQSIERNVSERDVYRYLKHRGFPNQILSDYTRFCLLQSHPTTSFPSAPSQNTTSITTSNDASTSNISSAAQKEEEEAAKKPTKEELRLLSSKYSFNKRILNKAKKLQESQNVVGRLLENCMRIVAEEEARHKSVEASRKGKERAIIEASIGHEDGSQRSGKGNYMGRKKMVDKSVETDPSLVSSSITASRGLATPKASDRPRRTSDTTTRLPTPTSPPPRTTSTLPTTSTSNSQASSSKNDTARAAKAAQLAAQFKYVLNTKHLNYNKADLEKFQLPRNGLQLQPKATTVSSSSSSSSAGIESRSASTAVGQSAIPSSTAAERSNDTSRREIPNGPRAPIHPALVDMGSTRTGTTTGKEGTSSSSRPVEAAAGTITSAKATPNIPPAAAVPASTEQQNSAAPSSKPSEAAPPAMPTSSGDAMSSNASHQRGTSIYDMVPEYIVQKKKSPHMKFDALPVVSNSDSQSMQVDTAPTGATSTNVLPSSSTEGVPNPANIQMSIDLPSNTDRNKGKAREKNDGNQRKEDVAQWFGSAEPDHGAVYSPLEMDDGPPPPSETAPSVPAPPSTAPISRTADTAPSFTARPVRTSMSPPPPPSRGSRQGSAGSPPPSGKSALPAPPSHLPARPNVPTPTDPKVIKAMFLSSNTKSSASSLPKKPHSYNPIQSTNEPVALPQREVKSIDPRKLAAERAKMLREERESESDRAGSPTLPSSATTTSIRNATSTSAQQPTGQNTSSGRTALLQGQKDVQESSASPDIVPQRETSHREAAKANSPPIPSKAQQAANANMPLPSFRKAGQTNEDARDTAAVNTDQREAELRNRLKRNREENEGLNSVSNKRPTRDIGASTTASKSKASESDSAKDTSPPPATKSKNARTSSSTAPTSTRRLINSQGRRVSDLRQNHDVSDLSDEDGAVTVAASRSTDKASSPAKKKKSVPVIEVEETASRQGSVVSSIREGSADSRSGTVKKVVARKSTGGPKKKLPPSAAPPSFAASPSQSTSSMPEPAKEPIKLKFTIGGSKNANGPSASQTSSSTPRTVTSGPSKSNTSQSARKVIEIDDSSDDTDEDDIPLRKPPSTVKKAPRSSTMADVPAATPPSSANKPRPRARPLAGSGKRLSDIGTDDVDKRRGSSSTEDDDSLRPLRQSQKPSAAPSTSNNEEAVEQPSAVAAPTPKKALSPPRNTLVQDSALMQQAKSASPATEPEEEDEIVSDSVSEAYSPSQMPRYSLSPVPDESAPELSTAQSSSDAVAQSATLLGPPAVKMTQVASSQSPEDSQALRRESDAAFDEDIDMLASDSEDNAIAEDLLKDTLDDLPDLLPTPTGEVQSTTMTTEQTTTTVSETVPVVQETTSATTIVDTQPEFSASQVDPSTQRNFVDPMDLSQAFGSDEEDGDGESLSGHLDVSTGNEDQPAQLERDSQKAKSPTMETGIRMETGSRMETASFAEHHNSDRESTREQEPLRARHLDLQDVKTQARTETSQPKRATAADFMASQEVPSAPENASDRTPVLPSAVLPAQVSASSADGRALTAGQYTSPMVPPSEAESFEIIMEGQSPMKSFLPNSESTSTPALGTRPRVDLSALDRPLEDPLTKCRYGTGCLDMNCIFAHPSPSLSGPMSRSAPFPTSRLECGDGVSCRLPTCPYTHPSPAARRKEICANQANCPYGAKCVYRHVDQGNSQLAHRYTSHNQSARFNNPVSAPPQQDNARQHLSPPPSIVPGMTTLRTGSKVTSTTLPFYSHHPMPAMPAGTPPLSRSASPAVNVRGGASAGVSGGLSATTVANNAATQATSSYPATFHYQQQQQQVPQQGPNRSWTNNAKGWLASFTGASKPT